MPLVYATPADLDQHQVDLDDPDATLYIRAASGLVRRVTRSCRYDVTPAGAPAREDVAEAFRDAVVAQVLTWVHLGVNPTHGTAGVQDGGKQSQSLLGGSVTYAVRAGAADDKARTVTELVPAALDCLIDVPGLVWAQPGVH